MPTVITTNYDGEEIKDRVGERIADRLREMCEPVALGGESWRGQKRHLELVKQE